MSVGVVIGRFQVADLHEVHSSLLDTADRRHSKLCIFVKVNPSQLNTQSDPLDYPTRELMLKRAFPNAQVFELIDEYTVEGWSRTIDSRLSVLYPRDKVELYCDSLYAGKHKDKVVVLGKYPPLSKEMRDAVGETVENVSSFRRGVIYAAYNRWPSIYPCVDIACTRTREDVYEVLVGKRDDEGGVHRFPGGHIDPPDETDEKAARRELSEETGVEAGPMKYLWSGAIKSWVDREGGGRKRTIFFQCDYLHGSAQGRDDLSSVRWVHVADLGKLLWADDHKKLAQVLMDAPRPPVSFEAGEE